MPSREAGRGREHPTQECRAGGTRVPVRGEFCGVGPSDLHKDNANVLLSIPQALDRANGSSSLRPMAAASQQEKSGVWRGTTH